MMVEYDPRAFVSRDFTIAASLATFRFASSDPLLLAQNGIHALPCCVCGTLVRIAIKPLLRCCSHYLWMRVAPFLSGRCALLRIPLPVSSAFENGLFWVVGMPPFSD